MSSSTDFRGTFDLRDQSLARGRAYRSARIAMAVIGFLFALVLGFILADALRASGLSTPIEWLQFLVLVPGLGCMVALMFFASYKLGAGATSVTVGSEGLVFTWKSGYSEPFPCVRTCRGITLLDYTVTPGIPKLTGVSWELRRSSRPASYLSAEAFTAILQAAEAQGIRVNSAIPSSTDFRHNFWGWARCRIITFSP
jgi:hypothetical protein